ncbi:MAG: type III-B CRISPR-associated protein Cas10/Cmr2 [gamma proteobacterium endosymbiont of Lamellibrachia anaximandri]|nr:type III-B CRISPR-associated protein Cas10/Cmr2 [gamma proteobacterium endosymbiont of Lamellibrachia anaximandri]MBL3535493.1 type III-B CRISPR-associated protein Cas10/Cmr2 [gamma proteobacterium endosymbiont of Lamellibrachia anaximandri]
MSDRYFYFTLGPVQGFVSQARRTRDFWGGSFLLSWLSGCAMLAVKKQGGKILFPLADDAYLNWIEGIENGDKPRQGNIPNRFKAEVGGNFNPEQVVETVNSAWKALAQEVWDEDLQGVAGEETEEIWDRQHQAFWEIAWAETDDEKDSSLLDRVKNWRTHLSPDEPGVKCMVMDGWQELSAASGPGKGVKTFWDDVRSKGKKGMRTDLREGENICAIAFVKRRFAHYFEQLSMDMPGGWKLQGWALEAGVPSVQYMAAARWLETAYRKGDSADAAAFHQAANALTQGYGEWATDLQCLRDFSNTGEGKRLTSLDGGVFFESLLENRNLWDDTRQAEKVKTLLVAWRRSAQLDPVSPFYAILLMDGDSLGKQMSVRENQGHISAALKGFTQAVPEVVDEHSGFLIYTGGDDVLAVLPVEDAFACALALRNCYSEQFKTGPVTSTLSGAIEFAHIKMPLGKVLGDGGIWRRCDSARDRKTLSFRG